MTIDPSIDAIAAAVGMLVMTTVAYAAPQQEIRWLALILLIALACVTIYRLT